MKLSNFSPALIRTAIGLAGMTACSLASFPVFPAETTTAPLSTRDFFRHATYSDMKISPSGRFVAATTLVDDKYYLVILDKIDTSAPEMKAIYGMDGDIDVYRFYWVDDDRVLFNISTRIDSLEAPRQLDDLFLAYADHKELHPLYNSGYAHLIGLLPGDPDSIAVQIGREALKLNLRSGNTRRLGDASLPGVEYFLDHKGALRIAVGDTDEKSALRVLDDKPFESWSELDSQTAVFEGLRSLDGLGFSADDKTFYYQSDEGGATSGVFALDVASGTHRLVFRDAKYDVSGVITARDGVTPIGVFYGVGRQNAFYFDPASDEAKLRTQLTQLFPDEDVRITSYSKDMTRAMAVASSDRSPSRFYILDFKQGDVRLFFRSQPWIDETRMAPKQLVQVTARDGVPLDAFLTLPIGSANKKFPLVVLPHGGPFGITDRWSYDPDVQFLAHHGYGVLQVNYRGSSGYGAKFLTLGFRQWGGAIQNDIIDATRWAIGTGTVDKDRIAIFGASFGGYSAMEAPIRSPGLYRCAIGYAGVYNLRDLLVSAYQGNKPFLHLTLGDDTSVLNEQSPALHVDQLKIPVFLIHGEDDQIAHVDQYRDMAAALKALNSPLWTMLKKNEEHGFYKLENNVELFDALLAFLQANFGSGVSPVNQPDSTK